MYHYKLRILLTSFYPASHNNSQKLSIKEFIVFFLIIKLYFNKNNNLKIWSDLPMYKSNKFKVLRAPYKNKNAWTPYGFSILTLPINITSNISNHNSYNEFCNNLKIIKSLVESFGVFKVHASVCKSTAIINFNNIVDLQEWAK